MADWAGAVGAGIINGTKLAGEVSNQPESCLFSAAHSDLPWLQALLSCAWAGFL